MHAHGWCACSLIRAGSRTPNPRLATATRQFNGSISGCEEIRACHQSLPFTQRHSPAWLFAAAPRQPFSFLSCLSFISPRLRSVWLGLIKDHSQVSVPGGHNRLYWSDFRELTDLGTSGTLFDCHVCANIIIKTMLFGVKLSGIGPVWSSRCSQCIRDFRDFHQPLRPCLDFNPKYFVMTFWKVKFIARRGLAVFDSLLESSYL